MLDGSDLLVEPSGVQLLDVTSIEKDLTFIRIVEPLNKRDDGTLAAARGSTEGNDAVSLVVDAQRNTFKDVHSGFTRVLELDILELKPSIDHSFNLVSTTLVDKGLIVHDLNNLVRGALN